MPVLLLGGVLGGCGDSKRELMPGAKRTKLTLEAAPLPETPKPEPPKPASPAQEAQADYFPHRAGDTWNLVESVHGETNQVVLSVRTGSEKSPEAFTVETSRNGEVVQRETYRADETGVYRESAGYPEAGKIVPPMPILQSPLKSGAEWSWKGALKYPDLSIPGEATFKVDGPEAVKTQSGTYQAFRVVQKFTLSTPSGGAGASRQTVVNTQWLAPGVGLVKMATESGEGAELSFAELTSFQTKAAAGGKVR